MLLHRGLPSYSPEVSVSVWQGTMGISTINGYLEGFTGGDAVEHYHALIAMLFTAF